jgi:outer membrane protein assembly factor BamD (BamD/ComL family)
MTDQSTDNFIANYEQSQKQNHARFLKQIKAEFRQLRDEQRHQRMHSFNSPAPPPAVGT